MSFVISPKVGDKVHPEHRGECSKRSIPSLLLEIHLINKGKKKKSQMTYIARVRYLKQFYAIQQMMRIGRTVNIFVFIK